MSQIPSATQTKSISQKSTHQYTDSTDSTVNITDSELVKQVNDLKHQVKILTLENEVFEKTILRLDPALMNGVQQALEYASKCATKFNASNSSSMIVGSYTRSGPDLALTTGGTSRLFTSTSRISAVSASKRKQSNIAGTILCGTGPRINVLERSELVSQEIELIIVNHKKTEKKAAQDQAMLSAKLEEICVRVADVDKAVANFQQQVIVEGWDKIAKRIPAEVWIKFMREWVKIIDGKIGKLRLRTSTLNTQYHTLRSQIRVKTELNECLRPVDFEKMKIENRVCEEVIEQKLSQLEEVKQMTGDANLYLTLHKKAAVVQDNYLINVRQTIKNLENGTVQMDKESEVIQAQADALAEKLDQVQRVRLKYEVPDIMDYVGVKSELADLKHSVQSLENRLKIAQIAVSSIAKKLNSMYFLRKKESRKV